jgi:hypothetical protein
MQNLEIQGVWRKNTDMVLDALGAEAKNLVAYLKVPSFNSIYDASLMAGGL